MRFFYKLFVFFLLVFLISAFSGLAMFLYYSKDLPDPSQIGSREITQSTKIYDRTGESLLFEIHGEERRTVIPFNRIPDYVKNATVVIEDDNFYNHAAFDLRAILRAFIADIIQGKRVQGGSTITQQLVKNAFLTPEKTIVRKIKELALAIQMERQYSKDEILDLYLNQVPYGSNAYGIEAASLTFFDKPASELNLAESSLLSALPNRPSYYSPYGSHLSELKARQEFILEKMRTLGYVDEEELVRAKRFEFVFAPPTNEIRAPHFVMYVREYLNARYGEDFVEKAGLRVITTLDLNYQELAQKAVEEGVKRNKELYNGNNAAFVAQDPKTGQILALVGSVDYFDVKNDGNFNVATQGLRQPGSSFKPFAYLTAFSRGYTTETVIFDVKTDFDATGGPEDIYSPGNYDNVFRGPMTFRSALAQSVNIPAVKALYLAGIDNTITTAERLGITTLTDRSRYGLSLVLGGGEVKLIDMVNAYSVFSQEGVRHKQSIVLRVEDANGAVLEEYRDSSEQVFEPQYIRMLNDVLSDTQARSPLFGPNSSLSIPGHVIAAKTGTTNDFRDAWTIGYTPSLVAGVWVGNNDNTAMNVGGSSILAATPIWHAFVSEALKDKPLELFIKPSPPTTKKPTLSGKHIVEYPVGENKYPQVHSTLFYLEKNDPQGPQPENPALDIQFSPWENAVLLWAKNNIADFENYNRPIPAEYRLIQSGQHKPSIQISSLKNGDFVTTDVYVSANIEAPLGIKEVVLTLNNVLANRITLTPTQPAPLEIEESAPTETSSPAETDPEEQALGALPTTYTYSFTLPLSSFLLQNKLSLEVYDAFNNTEKTELLLYQ